MSGWPWNPSSMPAGPFRRGLCCGNPLPDSRIEQSLQRGFDVFRTNAKHATEVSRAQFAKHPCTPLWVIGVYGLSPEALARTAAEIQQCPEGALIELGNELNIGDGPAGMPQMSAADYATVCDTLRDLSEARRLTCYFGSVSNINPSGQRWLADVLRRCPWIPRVSIHRYPHKGDQKPSRSPYGTRAQEMAALRDTIGARRVLVSETGIQCGRRIYKTWFWWHAISEAQQLAYLREEVGYWRQYPHCDGVIVWVEGMAPQETYGLREGTDGRWRLAGDHLFAPPLVVETADDGVRA